MKKVIFSLWGSAAVFGLVGACGGDSSDPSGTTSTTTSPTTTSTTTSPTTTTGTTGTVTGTGGATSTGATTSTTGAVSDCMNVTGEGLAAATAQVPASQGVYSYGDGVTTMCISSPAANQVCLEGLGALAGDSYENYGAGLGIQLATSEPEEGWDATADGVVGVKFSIAGTSTSAPVRVGVTVVGLTNNGYVTNESGVTADGEQTLLFADLVQPSWSAATVTDPFDATNIHSLQFQLVTAQAATRPYDFCVTGITWIDAAGNPVELPWAMEGGEGGAGGEGGGAGAPTAP